MADDVVTMATIGNDGYIDSKPKLLKKKRKIS